MSLGERCDEITRLIDEVLGDQPAETTRDDATVAVVRQHDMNVWLWTNGARSCARRARNPLTTSSRRRRSVSMINQVCTRLAGRGSLRLEIDS